MKGAKTFRSWNRWICGTNRLLGTWGEIKRKYLTWAGKRLNGGFRTPKSQESEGIEVVGRLQGRPSYLEGAKNQ